MKKEDKKSDEELINMRVSLEKGLHEKYMTYKAQTRETFCDFVRRKIRELKMP